LFLQGFQGLPRLGQLPGAAFGVVVTPRKPAALTVDG
jgi:hypothetical protein